MLCVSYFISMIKTHNDSYRKDRTKDNICFAYYDWQIFAAYLIYIPLIQYLQKNVPDSIHLKQINKYNQDNGLTYNPINLYMIVLYWTTCLLIYYFFLSWLNTFSILLIINRIVCHEYITQNILTTGTNRKIYNTLQFYV